jgi:hypothetical protein
MADLDLDRAFTNHTADGKGKTPAHNGREGAAIRRCRWND